jgi:multidrug resistance efflux pump
MENYHYNCKNNIALAISGLSTASTQYKSASALVKVAENQLALTKASATPEEIKAKEALVDQAKASVESAKANLEKSIIRSPISGTISRIDGKLGDCSSRFKYYIGYFRRRISG